MLLVSDVSRHQATLATRCYHTILMSNANNMLGDRGTTTTEYKLRIKN